jgi:glycine/D-amino acid oxidase-like deaminating enzyme
MIAEESAVTANALWTATANPAPACPPLEGRAETTVAILGAGVTGLSAALHLAERGVAVTVLEARSIGWGASGRNGGQLNPGLKLDPDAVETRFGAEMGGRMLRLSGEAPSLALSLAARHGIACDAVQPGWLLPAHDARALETLEAKAEQWRRRGVAMRMLSRAEITELTGTPIYVGGLLDPRGGSVHPLNYTMGLARAALAEGAVIHEASPASALRREGATLVLTTPAGELRAEKLLLCTNAQTDDLVPPLARTLVPVRSVQVATEPLPEEARARILPGRHAAADSRRVMVYYRVDGAGRLLMGGRGDYSDRVTAALLENLRRVTRRMFPELEGIRFTHAWGGFVAMTADHLPHLTPHGPGILSATGYNGRGLALGTAMGRVVADWAGGAAEAALDFPITPAKPIPFHLFRKPAVRGAVQLFRLRDALGI